MVPLVGRGLQPPVVPLVNRGSQSLLPLCSCRGSQVVPVWSSRQAPCHSRYSWPALKTRVPSQGWTTPPAMPVRLRRRDMRQTWIQTACPPPPRQTAPCWATGYPCGTTAWYSRTSRRTCRRCRDTDIEEISTSSRAYSPAQDSCGQSSDADTITSDTNLTDLSRSLSLDLSVSGDFSSDFESGGDLELRPFLPSCTSCGDHDNKDRNCTCGTHEVRSSPLGCFYSLSLGVKVSSATVSGRWHFIFYVHSRKIEWDSDSIFLGSFDANTALKSQKAASA